MEYDDTLRKRGSSREYIDKDVKAEHIGRMIEAANLAPSSGNLQNWSFIVVRGNDLKEKIALACLRQMWMLQAPVLIVVCNKRKEVTDLYPKRGMLYSVQNCACAANNLMLKAADLGLSTCWVGAFNEDNLRKVLEIPETVFPEMIISVGYSDEVSDAGRKPFENVAYFEKYGKRTVPDDFNLKQRASNVIGEVKEKSKLSRLKGLFKV